MFHNTIPKEVGVGQCNGKVIAITYKPHNPALTVQIWRKRKKRRRY